jgi:hypothetical protein
MQPFYFRFIWLTGFDLCSAVVNSYIDNSPCVPLTEGGRGERSYPANNTCGSRSHPANKRSRDRARSRKKASFDDALPECFSARDESHDAVLADIAYEAAFRAGFRVQILVNSHAGRQM